MKIIIMALITSILISLPIVSSAENSCKNIKFAIQNDSDLSIKLLKVQYLNESTGKRIIKQFPDVICAPNRFCRTVGQNLPKVRNVKLNYFVFHYRILNQKTGKWSGSLNLPAFNPKKTICISNRTYGGRHWFIGKYI